MVEVFDGTVVEKHIFLNLQYLDLFLICFNF